MSKNLFMMCEKLNPKAFTTLLDGYQIRHLKEDELDIWKTIHFDNDEDKKQYKSFMDQYFNDVYSSNKELFFKQCLVVINKENQIIGTCFLWQAYQTITTVHWFKVVNEEEGKGIGRALLSKVLSEVTTKDMPIYLHTHPECKKAIKLYLDFGFNFIEDLVIGTRENHISEFIEEFNELYGNITLKKAPKLFLEVTKNNIIDEF